MVSFKWDKHFLTGLKEVDQQHHHLVDLINEFGNLIAKNTINIEDVDSLYKQLEDYTVYHFNEEDKMSLEADVDILYLDHHRKIHDSFIQDIKTIYSNITAQSIDQASNFLKFLLNWLAYHILGEDQDLAKQVKAIQSGMSPQEAFRKLQQERDSATAPLLKALMGLFEQVSLQNRELTKLNDSLEEKVLLRTRELSEANQHLEELSLTDALTGLPNRRYVMKYLPLLWTEAVQKDQPLSCLMIDADHFKEVNDKYGHDAGDTVLIELARTLRETLHNDDILCRLGGDEFFAICPNTDRSGGLHIAELLRHAISKLRVPTSDSFWHGSISIGVSSRVASLNNYEELIKIADKGVYAAKEAGKNCVRMIG